MNHKIYLKKAIWIAICITILGLLTFAGVSRTFYQKIVSNQNQKIGNLIEQVKKEYPEVKQEDLVRILSQEYKGQSTFGALYGIDVDTEAIVEENTIAFRVYLWGGLLGMLLFAMALVGIFLLYNRRKDRELKKIAEHLDAINHQDYRYDMDSISEDELSILKNEVYKTTIMLKETAAQSLQAKNSLKDSLSDISHQLKTPLASISLTLDNVIDHPEMEKERRASYLRTIRRQMQNMNFLIQSLLKLSELDANAITFHKETISAGALAKEAMENVATLSDLRDVTVNIAGDRDALLCCDRRWQVEAVTNILKNAVEHSEAGGKVEITMGKNAIYTWISIRDYGEGMDAEDQKHIFERFYKGKHSKPDSIGIGLSLAKSIVESENGNIFVESNENCTTFSLRYYEV